MPMALPTLPAPGAIERRRQLAESILAQGLQSGPVGHWTQGAARMAQSLVGALGMRRADREEKEGKAAGAAGTQALMQALLGGGVQSSIQPMSGSPAGGSMAAAGNMEPAPAPGADREALLKAVMAAQDNEWVDPAMKGIAMQQLMPKPEEAYTMSPGQSRFKGGQLVAAMPSEPDDLPGSVQEYQFAVSQGFTGTYAEWEASQKSGMSLQVDPETGEVTFQQGANIKPLTEGQSKDTVYYTRMSGALPLIDQHGEALTRLGESMGGQVPIVGNYLKSSEYQLAEQAGNEFITAVLRKDTGATVTPGESTLYGDTYLPRPGDGPEVLKQKQDGRKRAMEAVRAGMPPLAIVQAELALRKSAPQQQAPGPQAAPSVPQAESMPAASSSDIFDDEATIPEGATVEDEQGRRFKKQNGQMVPVQ